MKDHILSIPGWLYRYMCTCMCIDGYAHMQQYTCISIHVCVYMHMCVGYTCCFGIRDVNRRFTGNWGCSAMRHNAGLAFGRLRVPQLTKDPSLTISIASGAKPGQHFSVEVQRFHKSLPIGLKSRVSGLRLSHFVLCT